MTINGQSAAKLLSTDVKSEYEEGSTTIPRKGSTILYELEKAHTKLYNLKEFKQQESGIYIIYNQGVDKCYIGSSFNIKSRLLRHLNYLKRNCHHSLKFQRAYNKYGIDSFKIGVLTLCGINSLKEKEEFWINLLQSHINGYNNTNICRVIPRFKLTEEQKKKAVKSSQIEVVALSFDGELQYTFESVNQAAKFFNSSSSNISSCCKGKSYSVKDHLFKYKKDYDSSVDNSYKYVAPVRSEEYRKKLSLGAKGKSKTETQLKILSLRCSQKVKRININNEEVNYTSLKECCLENKLYIKTLKKAILAKTLLGGFYYEFVKI